MVPLYRERIVMRVIEKQIMAVLDTIRYNCRNSMKIVTIDGIGPKAAIPAMIPIGYGKKGAKSIAN